MSKRILVIEDEYDIRDVIASYLRVEGYDVTEAENGLKALSLFNEESFDLVISDIMMPGIDGFEVLKAIRLVSDVPMIMLTAKAEEVDRLKGFDTGADDYITKPFSPKEVVSRVKVWLRRIYGEETGKIIVKPFILDTKKLALYKGKDMIALTTKEFEIMQVFMTNPEQLLSREQLIEKVFGYDYEGYSRNIDAMIKKIRQKIEEDAKSPVYLRTKYGAGYIFGGDGK